MTAFEKVGSETIWRGHIGEVRIERYRHADGEEVVREVVGHPGAVAIVAHDDVHVWLVRQPREICDEHALLEVPAGKRDADGEPPLETGGPYGQEGWVWQSYAPLAQFDGMHAVIGSWIVGEEAVGIGMREDASAITRDTSYFVPHYFE